MATPDESFTAASPPNAASPASSTAITAAPAGAALSGAPAAGRANASSLQRRGEEVADLVRKFDYILLGLAVVLAFLAASFPARNSDFWHYLATGRTLVQGQYTFGSDPFSYTGQGAYWADHSWLLEGVLYLLYSTLGGPALVVLKALLIAVLAGLLLWRASQVRTEVFGWWPAVAVGLGLLALAPWLEFRPLCFSLLFATLTLWFLERGTRWLKEAAPAGTPPTPADLSLSSLVVPTRKAYWPVLALFVLWVNVDQWFFVGPLTVALYGAGVYLERRSGSFLLRALAVLLAASVAVCLVNPHHFFAFTVPPEVAQALWNGSLLDRLINAPAPPEFFGGGIVPFLLGVGWVVLSALGLTALILMRVRWSLRQSQGWALLLLVGLDLGLGVFLFDNLGAGIQVTANPGLFLATAAWWLLVALGLVAIQLQRSRAFWPEVAPWAGFLLLSLAIKPLLPFFALVAAPLLARNFLAGVRERWGPVAERQGAALCWTLAARPITILASLAVVALAWTGWLQADPYGVRSWADEPDASLVRVAEQLHTWQQEGKLGAAQGGLNISPAVGDYLAWINPADKSFCDSRASFGPGVLDDLRQVQNVLFGPLPEGDPFPPLRKVLRKWDRQYLVLHADNPLEMAAAFKRLSLQPKEWPLLFLEGRTAVFGWRDPEQKAAAERFKSLEINLHHQAFPEDPAVAATVQWSGELPPEPQWWDWFVRRFPTPSPRRDEAALYLVLFDAVGPDYRGRQLQAWQFNYAANQIGDLLSAGGCLDGVALLSVHTHKNLSNLKLQRFMATHDAGPMPLLYLTIRAARQAIRANPYDPLAHLFLGQAYLKLSLDTSERAYAGTFPLLARVRTIQAITALKESVRLKPNLIQAHASLRDMYKSMGYWDLALEHQRHLLVYRPAFGLQPGQTPKQFALEMKFLSEELIGLDKKVKELTEAFTKETAGKLVSDQLHVAGQMGLAGKQLDILLKSDVSAFGAKGTWLELQLLLKTGEVRKFREWMTPEQEDFIGSSRYHELQMLFAAAVGDYIHADKSLAKMMQTRVAPPGFLTSLGIILSAASQPAGKEDGPDIHVEPVTLPASFAMLAGQVVLNRASPQVVPLAPQILTLDGEAAGMAGVVIRDLDTTVLRGLLALEVGRTKRARDLFWDACVLWRENVPASEMHAAVFWHGSQEMAASWRKILRPSRP